VRLDFCFLNKPYAEFWWKNQWQKAKEFLVAESNEFWWQNSVICPSVFSLFFEQVIASSNVESPVIKR